MTVSSANYRNDYNGNGTTTVFAYNFKIQDSAQIEVILVSSAGVETTQTLTTHYTLSGVGDAGGGNVTMVTAPASGEKLVVRRTMPYIQETDYVSGDPFPAETHEAALDELTMADQAQNEALARCIQAPDQESSISKLPIISDRASKMAVFTAGGSLSSSDFTTNDVQTLVNSYSSGSAVSDASAITYTPAGVSALSSNVQTVLRRIIYPQDFGAVADGATDNQTAINNMFTHMASLGGGICVFPPGTYNIGGWVNYQVADGGNALILGYGAKINNTSTNAGYPSDAFRIGNADLAKGEGGTNASPYTYTEHVQVQGFEFLSCRMGVWFVRCKHSGYRDLSANGNACVGIGNDASENCYDMTGENAHMISFANKRGADAWYVVGAFTVDGLVLKGIFSGEAEMGGNPPNAKHLVLKSCTNYDVSGFIIDEKNSLSGGIEVTELDGYGILGPGIIRNCKNGLVTFPGGGNFIHQKIIKDIIIENCDLGVSCTSRQTIFDGIKTVNCTVDLAVETDADKCTFKNCEWGNDTITEGVAGRIAAMAWMNNIGGPMQNSVSVLGANAGNRVNVVAAPPSGANFTGDGTAYTLINWTESADNYNNFDPVTGLFTSVDYGGKYEFTINVLLTNLTASGCTLLELKALYNGGSPVTIDYISNFGNTHLMRGNYKVSLNRNDTISFTVTATGGTKVVGIGAGIGRLEVVQLHN